MPVAATTTIVTDPDGRAATNMPRCDCRRRRSNRSPSSSTGGSPVLPR